MIEILELKKVFDNVTAIEGINLKINKGEIFVILGPNGAGKTTTIRILTCIINPTEGNAYIDGMSILEEKKRIRGMSGLLTENPGLYERFNAIENLKFFSSLYGMDERSAEEKIKYYLEKFSLWERRNDPVGNFSKGMKQKLALIRALIHDPDYIYLDEPTASLDPETSKIVRDFIKDLKKEGKTVILSTHNLTEAEYLADHIAVLNTRIVAFGTPDNLRREVFGKKVVIEFTGNVDMVTKILNEMRLNYYLDKNRIIINEPGIRNSIIVETLVKAGVSIEYVYDESHTLEELYLRLVNNDGHKSD
ncbi:MAG: ABC transporter ATP-binding protein [Thermoplasmata archaeon]|jgi:ABC-2 type transport system ATP-binding protein|nr:ABC transporter ATP-binding protein [Thermoplasmata archaeon]